MSGSDVARLEELNGLKKTKLLQQKEKAKEFNHALTDSNGLNENSRLKMKNLVAGIVASKQPGYFKYHQDNERVAQIESQGALQKYAADIKRLGDDVDKIDAEVAEIKERMKKKREPPKMDSLEQWVAHYGKVEDRPDRMTQFKKSSKIYGGTKHYSSFKSSATTMKPGLCTK